VTLNLNTSFTDARYAQLGGANIFAANQTISGSVTATSFSGNGAGLSSVNATTFGGMPSSAFATLGANTFTGNQNVTGNLNINGGGNGLIFPDGSAQTTAAMEPAANPLVATLTAGTSVASGTCISQKIAAQGATTSMAVIISPAGDPASNGLNELIWGAFVDSVGSVTAQFCHFSRSTAMATANQSFNLRVIK